jgi:hypothetical protein
MNHFVSAKYETYYITGVVSRGRMNIEAGQLRV